MTDRISHLEMDDYEYRDLDGGDFRLLVLHPGAWDDDVSVSLEHRDLTGSENSYEALSYVWGEVNDYVSIRCDDDWLIKVTTNLSVALRRLRLRDVSRMMWIDAICINQDDVRERNQQVPLMRYIYPGASKVVIWLGEADEASELAIWTIREWASIFANHRLNIRDLFGQRYMRRNDYQQTLSAIRKFCQRPWFSRTWTFQEIVISREPDYADMVCGSTILLWQSLRKAFFVAEYAGILADSFGSNPNVGLRLLSSFPRRGTGYTWSISQLLRNTFGLKATDPRDKIFSLLGLANFKDESLFRPNYFVPVRPTYISFTLSIIKDSNMLSILADVDREARDPELPSWVPDWRASPCTYALEHPGIYNVNAGFQPQLEQLPKNHDFEITLDGAYLDNILETRDLSILRQDLTVMPSWDFYPILSAFRELLNLPDTYAPTSEGIVRAIFKTLSEDRNFHTSRLNEEEKQQYFPGHYYRQRQFIPLSDRINQEYSILGEITYQFYTDPWLVIPEAIRGSKESLTYQIAINKIYENIFPSSTSSLQDSPRLSSSVQDTARLVVSSLPFGNSYHTDEHTLCRISREAISPLLTFMHGRSFFITQRGFIGIGPRSAKPGDVLCSIFGSTVPFLLRSAAEAEKYQLIGEAYVHGMMDGEMWECSDDCESIKPTAEGVSLAKFTLV